MAPRRFPSACDEGRWTFLAVLKTFAIFRKLDLFSG
jgi:hypothetical protein